MHTVLGQSYQGVSFFFFFQCNVCFTAPNVRRLGVADCNAWTSLTIQWNWIDWCSRCADRVHPDKKSLSLGFKLVLWPYGSQKKRACVHCLFAINSFLVADLMMSPCHSTLTDDQSICQYVSRMCFSGQSVLWYLSCFIYDGFSCWRQCMSIWWH